MAARSGVRAQDPALVRGGKCVKRSLSIALLLAGALAALGACARLDRSVRVFPLGSGDMVDVTAGPRFDDFRQAFANLDFSAILEADLDVDSRTMLRAVRSVMDGDMAGAEALFRGVAEQARESWVRRTAGEILVQLLFFQSKWGELSRLIALASAADGSPGGDELPFRELNEGFAESYRFSDRPEVMPLKLSLSGSPLIPVRIRGRQENFWLDTGSSLSVLATDLADRLQISPLNRTRGLASTSTYKRIGASLTVIDAMRIGALEISNHPAMIVNTKDLFFKIPGIFQRRRITRVTGVKGILGMNAIQHLLIRLDYHDRRITIRRPERQGSGERNLFWLGYPILICRGANGARLYFGLDTGAWHTVISPTIFAKIGPSPSYRMRLKLWGAGGEMKVRTQILHRFQLLAAGRRFEFNDVLVLPLNFFGFITLDGILGNDFFSGCGRVAFDLANGKFAIE